MAYQHFYSRVPARVSLYNKIDGFDTFAHSAALDREFILGELSRVYKDLLPLHDPIRIRRGEIPTVYSQALLPSGRLVHTAVKYLPTDFTGERSAYLAHSRVLTDEERAGVIRNSAVDPFNRGMFITDISLFKLTDRGVMANPNCPEHRYAPSSMLNHSAAMKSYHPEMLKSFFFSVVSAIVEGARPVYFRLPLPDAAISEAAVDFVNGIMSVLPYSLRERLSFVSYVNDAESYPDFLLKGVGVSFAGVESEKGVFYDFSSGVVTGVSGQSERGAMVTNFLYSLYEQPKIREAFHQFMQRIEKRYESLSLDIQTLKEIIFLFWQCCGYYVESSVLPTDDAVCRLFDIYAKYRDGLVVEHRVQVYRCLTRYSEAQVAIPDSVFSRMSRLYPTDCVEAKAVGLDVLLNLIHVDLMRDSLFCFITRNYPTETEGVRAVIVSNLSRVFYGGFLQNNILTFFDIQFRREPVHTKDVILDKLLLSIRTPEVQGQIIAFIDKYYPILNSAQKLKICNTCLEMLPECDELSSLLTTLINRRIGAEESDISSLMNKKLSEMLMSYLSAGDGRLAAIFMENLGFCEDIVLRHALNQWQGSEIIIGILASMPAAKRAQILIRAHRLVKGENEHLYAALLYRFAGMGVAVWPSTLGEMLSEDSNAIETLPAEHIPPYRQMVIYPAVVFTIYQAFGPADGPSVDSVISYADANPYIASTEEYRVITDYLAIVRECDLGDTEDAFKLAMGLPNSADLRRSIGEYLKAKNYKPDYQDAETLATYELLIDYLSTGNVDFAAVYSVNQKRFEDMLVEEKRLGEKAAARRSRCEAIELVISCASEICDASDDLAGVVMSDESGLKRVIADFISFYGIGAGAFLKKRTKDAYFEIEELASELVKDRNDAIGGPIDAINLLLGKKDATDTDEE